MPAMQGTPLSDKPRRVTLHVRGGVELSAPSRDVRWVHDLYPDHDTPATPGYQVGGLGRRAFEVAKFEVERIEWL